MTLGVLVKNFNTAVLLIGFGGPASPQGLEPFLKSVLEGRNIPDARLAEVRRHYAALGGRSPYNAHVERFRELLEACLNGQGVSVPVLVGFRHSIPSLGDLCLSLGKLGIRSAAAFVLSSFRSQASFERYRAAFEEERKKVAGKTEIVYTRPFYSHPLFVESQANRIREKIPSIPEPERNETFFIYSAHSIPSAMARESRYTEEFEEHASRVSQKLGIIKGWSAAYQSRSGDPRDPWLGPDVLEAIRGIDKTHFKNVLLVPSGFLCDNAEVVYDLDIEAKSLAEGLGLNYTRAATVLDEPLFMQMVVELIRREL